MLEKLDALNARLDAYDQAEKERADQESRDPRKVSSGRPPGAMSRKEIEQELKEIERQGFIGRGLNEERETELLRALKTAKDANEDEVREMPGDKETRNNVDGWRPSDQKWQAAMADAQARCDAVASMFSSSAPRPMDGEGYLPYRRRILIPDNVCDFGPFNLAQLPKGSRSPSSIGSAHT